MGGISLTRREHLLELEVKELGDDYYEWFLNMLADGQSVVFAHMCIMRETWSLKNSDKTFNEGQRRKMNNMHSRHRNNIVRIANKAGISTDGKYYVGGLGRYNDPHAWVSTADDVLEVCKKKNLTATGAVNHKGRPMPPAKKKLAEDIIQRQSQAMLKNDPRLAEKVRKGRVKKEEIRERVIAKHSRGRQR